MQKLRLEFGIEDRKGKVKNSEMKIKADEWTDRHLDKNDKKLRCYNNLQLIFFVLGMLVFILWLFLMGAYPLI